MLRWISYLEVYIPLSHIFSLRRGDLIRRSCPSVCWSIRRLVRPLVGQSFRPSVRQSVIDFLIFQKRGFESTNSNLSNTTKFILIDSLIQEVTAIVRLPNPTFSTIVRLPNPELNSVLQLPNRKFSALVRLPNPELSSVLRLPNQKFSALVRLPNPKS